MPQNKNKSNSRRRAGLNTILCLSLTITGSCAFTSNPAIQQVARPLHLTVNSLPVGSIPASSTQLHMARQKASNKDVLHQRPQQPLLTREEEMELLRQTAELRRLTQLEADLSLQNGGQLPLLSIRAKAAGYGEELDAYDDAHYDGQKAREELVTRNMGLVQYCVTQVLKNKKNQRLNSLSRDDLVQEGAIGLARAIDKYNPSIGGKFSTYAVYWIRAAVLRCIAERDDLLRVPNHVTQAISEIHKAAGRLGMELESASWKEAKEAKRLAEEAGLSERNFQEAMKVRTRRYTGGYVAFESWMQRGEDLATDVPSMDLSGSAEADTSALEKEHLRETLSKFLRPKEMEALSWRYGLLMDQAATAEASTPQERANQYLAQAEEELFGSVATPAPVASAPPAQGRFGEAMSFNEVGKQMKVSAEYGRRLCHAALAKLQDAAEDGRLEPALLF